MSVPRLRKSVVLALAGVVLCVTGCGSSSPGAAQRPHGAPELITIFEDEAHLQADPNGFLSLMRRFGVDRVRYYVRWLSFAPQPQSASRPAGFDGADPKAYPAGAWKQSDAIIEAAHKQGVGLDLTIGGGAPRWALGPGEPPNPFGSWRPSATDFGAFVRAVATRYSGHFVPAGAHAPLPRVDFWSIWDEPNYGPELAPQAIDHSTVEVSPALYRTLLDAAWSALSATGHAHDTILIGETAPRGVTIGDSPGNFSGMVPLRFIRALYCVGTDLRPLQGSAATLRGCPAGGATHAFVAAHPALFAASGFADHPYPQGGMAPNQSTPDEPDYADLASLPRLESTLDRARAAYGSFTPLPIWNTEFGYQTDPPETIAHTTNPAVSALYLNWSEYISWLNPRLRSYDQYLLQDPANAGATGGFATGLLFKDGVPKATSNAFRMPVFIPSGSGSGPVEVWGCVRPLRYARTQGSVAPVAVQEQRPGGGFRTVATVRVLDPYGYFETRVRLPRGARVRLQWPYPDGAVIHSRTATVGSG